MKTIFVLLAAATSLTSLRAADFNISIGPTRDRDRYDDQYRYEHWREYHHRHHGYWMYRRHWDDDRGVWVQERVWVPYGEN
jgi:hypothetical protein